MYVEAERSYDPWVGDCDHCKYWQRTGNAYGLCIRFPPTHIDLNQPDEGAQHLKTYHSQTCGEYLELE